MFDEIAHKHQVSLEHPIWFNLRIGNGRGSQRGFRKDTREQYQNAIDSLRIKSDELLVKLAANYNQKQRRVVITQLIISDGPSHVVLKAYRKTTAKGQKWHYEPEALGNLRIDPLFWNHFIPRIFVLSAQQESAQQETDSLVWYSSLTSMIAEILSSELKGITHIGPSRDFPSRAYRLTGESPRDVGQVGENWLSIFLQTKERAEVAKQVNYWLKRLGYTLRIEWGKQGYVHPMLMDGSGLETSLKDVGFGISQVLPLLVQGFASPRGKILILEQPEIHLHPRAQAELGDMLIAIANRGVKLLVETHSEHLLLRLRRRMAQSELDQTTTEGISHDDVAIYFIEHHKDHSQIHNITLGPAGEFVNPPDLFRSFFADDYQETLEWSKLVARIKQGQ